MTEHCPHCGLSLKPSKKPLVSLETNQITFRGTAVQLSSQLAEIAAILAKRMPGVASKEHLIERFWGAAPPERAERIAKVRVCQLRSRIGPIGLKIDNVWGLGYRMVAEPAHVTSPKNNGARTLVASGTPP